jgi:glyoxylase-like metal-dependent hydrolase (beta-lactamase superfamily II)
MATEVASRIHRLGNDLVNFYVVEDGEDRMLIDAGLPGFLSQLEAFLGSRRAGAVLLTHAHGDHVGIAEPLRRTGATVHVHEGDAEMARTAKYPPRERGMRPYFRHGTTWALLWMGLRNGAARSVKIAEVTPFGDDAVLDLPGQPVVVPTPGHSAGQVAFHFPDRGALIVGDALCTRNPLTGRVGPQIMPGAFSISSPQAMASLERIEGLEAGVMLVGHGDPWTGGVGAAVARAREAGPS